MYFFGLCVVRLTQKNIFCAEKDVSSSLVHSDSPLSPGACTLLLLPGSVREQLSCYPPKSALKWDTCPPGGSDSQACLGILQQN